ETLAPGPAAPPLGHCLRPRVSPEAAVCFGPGFRRRRSPGARVWRRRKLLPQGRLRRPFATVFGPGFRRRRSPGARVSAPACGARARERCEDALDLLAVLLVVGR